MPVQAGVTLRGLFLLVNVDLLVRPFQLSLEDPEVLDVLDFSERFLCFEEAGCRPAQCPLSRTSVARAVVSRVSPLSRASSSA